MEESELKPSLQKRQKRRDKRLGEEVIECYRTGWRTKQGKGHEKRLARDGFDGIRQRESIMFRHSGSRRSQTDNLEPLARFLLSHVGKHWDTVHSDLCRSLDGNTMTGQHVLDHLRKMVHTNVVKEGKRLISHDGHVPRDITENSHFRVAEFYVHPKSGVLLQTKPKRKMPRKDIRA